MIRSYHYNPEYHRLGGYICPSGEASFQSNNRGGGEQRCRHYTFEQENAERGGEGDLQFTSPNQSLSVFLSPLYGYRGFWLGYLKV
jgi:hypothetical protein